MEQLPEDTYNQLIREIQAILHGRDQVLYLPMQNGTYSITRTNSHYQMIFNIKNPEGVYNDEITFTIDRLNKTVNRYTFDSGKQHQTVKDVYKNVSASAEPQDALITELRNLLAQIN